MDWVKTGKAIKQHIEEAFGHSFVLYGVRIVSCDYPLSGPVGVVLRRRGTRPLIVEVYPPKGVMKHVIRTLEYELGRVVDISEDPTILSHLIKTLGYDTLCVVIPTLPRHYREGWVFYCLQVLSCFQLNRIMVGPFNEREPGRRHRLHTQYRNRDGGIHRMGLDGGQPRRKSVVSLF